MTGAIYSFEFKIQGKIVGVSFACPFVGGNTIGFGSSGSDADSNRKFSCDILHNSVSMKAKINQEDYASASLTFT